MEAKASDAARGNVGRARSWRLKFGAMWKEIEAQGVPLLVIVMEHKDGAASFHAASMGSFLEKATAEEKERMKGAVGGVIQILHDVWQRHVEEWAAESRLQSH